MACPIVGRINETRLCLAKRRNTKAWTSDQLGKPKLSKQLRRLIGTIDATAKTLSTAYAMCRTEPRR